MKKTNLLVLFIFFRIILLNGQSKAPKTLKVPVTNNYHGTEVVDDYQWLEKIENDEVKNWVDSQNKISEKYLNEIAKSSHSKLKMEKFQFNEMDYDFANLPEIIENDKVYFRLIYPNTHSNAAIYFKKGTEGSFEKLISPSLISSKDKIVFTNLIPSQDSRFLAYQYSRNGDDWKEIKIVQINKRHFFNETLKHTVSSEIYWFGQGFFYKKYPYSSAFGKRVLPQIMYHKLGTEQDKDILVFEVEDENESLRIYGVPKQDFYVIKKANSFTNKFSLYYLNSRNIDFKFKPIFENIDYNIDILDYKSDTVFTKTRIKNKEYIVSFPLDKPKAWKLLSPSYGNAVLTEYEILDDKIVISYQAEKSSFLSIIDFKGNVLGEVVTPDGLGIKGLFFSKEYNEFYFELSSYTVPPVMCKLDLKEFKFKYLGSVEVGFDAKKYKFSRQTFISHDGVKVPIFIVYKNELKKNGNTPFLLNTYGGYGIIAKPSFNPGIIYFIENGGAFAYVNVRGGGELGGKWWVEGKNLNKINTIKDFSMAAEFLVKEGYTKNGRIAGIGGSHGGLVVAGAILGNPELFGAAVMDVGVFDMLRFENSTVGSSYTSINEFGSIKVEEEFKNLYSYSPYHNVNYNVNYPSMLIVTGSDDTRVPPYHSYKFAAKLQNNPSQNNPVLLWSQDNTGHYGANRYGTKIRESSFIYGFLFEELKKYE